MPAPAVSCRARHGTTPAAVHRHLIRIARGTALGCAVALAPWTPGRAAALAAHAESDAGPTYAQGPSLVVRNRVLAVALLTGYGWSERQWRCLDRLWRRESNWNHLARNHGSGAYGIPQALPATKMRSAGADWRSSPATQIKWGLGYIGRRYGSPCAAWGHSEAAGWY
jgi:hypothetical protein